VVVECLALVLGGTGGMEVVVEDVEDELVLRADVVVVEEVVVEEVVTMCGGVLVVLLDGGGGGGVEVLDELEVVEGQLPPTSPQTHAAPLYQDETWAKVMVEGALKVA
jgi:hypothetical protein